MGEWIIGAFINLFGSIAINFGTNLLKLGHDERERHSVLGGDDTNGKIVMKPIIHFQTWRVGILFFAVGNCLNFVSFGYAAQVSTKKMKTIFILCFHYTTSTCFAGYNYRQSQFLSLSLTMFYLLLLQSLLAALGSVQFVSNIAFAYFVLSKTVTIKVLVATAFIVLGNIFLVSFGNHQSPVYTPEELAEKYSNIMFLLYCLILVLVVALHHSVYRRGELLLAVPGHDLKPYWRMLLPFSYAIVSGAVGSCSVLFAKSLSNLLRLSMSSSYQLHSWFTYSMLLLFLSTAGFWMARLNEGLSLFDAILIVPMFQIAWTFFSICTGFVYFQEYQVFGALRTTMFIVGMISVFIGISLLAPDEAKGGEVKDSALVSVASSSISTDVDRCSTFLYLTEDSSFRLIFRGLDTQIKDIRSLVQAMRVKAAEVLVKAKAACSLSLGLGENSLHASSVLVMPMVSSKMTGFRGSGFDRTKFSLRSSGWTQISGDEDTEKMLETTSMLTPSIH
ncbi:hypothetical protein RHGRI_022671 [Rhododendron griersonianum]|uniref:Probable magnesium transporter n=1 Tax=Rhododendron griersonianum TaxID=479676 RepID=A0AAV6J2X8_9ERIC|nr:hypothetical protein RHGRI_022671 [Rhododendron griersonianum]